MQGPYDVDGRYIFGQMFPKWGECVSLSALLFNSQNQFYHKTIYIERAMLIGSFCSHTLDTGKVQTNEEQEQIQIL